MGILKLTSTSSISWRWEIFDHGNPGIFTRGNFEFDAKFGEEGYFFDLRGHSKSSLQDLNWGPKVDFREGKVLNSQPGEFVDTDATYIPGDWYHVRVVFNNKLGDRGRFTLYLRNITRNESEILVGELNYFASNGPLQDVVQYSFGMRTLDQVPTTSFYIDNVFLEVE